MMQRIILAVRAVVGTIGAASAGLLGWLLRVPSWGLVSLFKRRVVRELNLPQSDDKPGVTGKSGATVGNTMNERTCTECNGRNLAAAQFCRHCGRPLDPLAIGGRGVGTAGRASHPEPLERPENMKACERAVDLFWRLESEFGGSRLIGTESLSAVVLNCGYSLKNAIFQVEGFDATGRQVFSLEKEVQSAPRGVEVRIEVASYEISDPVRDVRVSLVSAEFA